MKASTFALLAVAASPAVSALDLSISIQLPNLEQTPEALERQLAVRAVINESYAAYRQYAFGYDQLQPYSLNGVQTRNGWGATIVDALATLQIAGFEDWFYEGVRFVGGIDFRVSKTDQTVSVFETTIRYLGGMLAAYELSPTKDEILLQKATQLGESLSLAWSLGTDVPYGFLNLQPDNKGPIVDTSNIAEAGTLILEFDTLSHYTHNDTYRSLTDRSEKAIMAEPAPLPGLPAQGILPTDATPVGDYVTWGGGSDSYFEYLIKYALLTGNEDPAYLEAWKLAVDTTIHDLIRYSSVGNWTYSTDYSASNGGNLYLYSHLACFQGGNWILGGKLIGNQTIVDYGLQLVATCHNSYVGTATHIGPEGFAFIDRDTGSHNGWNPSPDDLAFYNAHGFAITASDYILRPEVVESYFYAYRVTGDTMYQDWAWDAFVSIRNYTKAPAAYSGIVDVNSIPPGAYDDLETFFFAELMKYFYLIFGPGDLISLDEYVFNTEAQPFRIRKPGVFDTVQHGFMPEATASFELNTGSLPVPSQIVNLKKLMEPASKSSGRGGHKKRTRSGAHAKAI